MHIFRHIFRSLFKSIKNKRVRSNVLSLIIGGIFGVSSYVYYQNARTYNDYITTIIPRYLRLPNEVDKNNFIVNVSNKCSPSVVAIEVRSTQSLSPTGTPVLMSTGSGFVAKSNGWIVTNAHVIMNKPNSVINVVAPNGESYEAIVTDIDLKLDLALLKINSNIPALELGESKYVLPGEWVVAIGSPLSMKHTVTAGVVSSIDRTSKELGMPHLDMKYIQTDAAITFGHSGGPLVNLNGEVIGVNNLRITAGIAFAIPISYVKDFLNRSELLSYHNEAIQNSMKHACFGITTLPVTPDVIENLLENQLIIIPEDIKGVLIWNVIQDSPAFKAGLQTGDLITHINHKSVQNVAELYIMLERCPKNDILFTLVRNGVIKAISYKQYT